MSKSAQGRLAVVVCFTVTLAGLCCLKASLARADNQCHADAGAMTRPEVDKAAALAAAEKVLTGSVNAPSSQPKVDIPKGADDVGSVLKKLSDAWKGGNWRLVIVGALVVVLYFLRRLGKQIPGKVGEWVASDRGGAWLTIATVVAFTLFVAFGGGSLDWDKLVDAILGACAVAGAYVLPKRAAKKD